MASLVLTYVAKLFLVLPLATESFVVSRVMLQNVTAENGRVPNGAILGTGSAAIAPSSTSRSHGNVFVKPKPRFALVNLMRTPVFDTVFVASAALINASGHWREVTPHVFRVHGSTNAATLLPAACALSEGLTPATMVDYRAIRYVLNFSAPVVQQLGCARSPTIASQASCQLRLEFRACPRNIDCIVPFDLVDADRATLPTCAAMGQAVPHQEGYRRDSVYPVSFSLHERGMLRLQPTLSAQFSSKSSEFYTFASAPALRLESWRTSRMNPVCLRQRGQPGGSVLPPTLPSFGAPASAMASAGVLPCDLPFEVARVELSNTVHVWLTFRVGSPLHLLLITAAAALSAISLLRRVFQCVNVASRQCGARTVARQTLATLCVQFSVFVFSVGLTATALATMFLVGPGEWSSTRLRVTTAVWISVSTLCLGVASLIQLVRSLGVCGYVRDEVLERLAGLAVRGAFLLQVPAMLLFMGPRFPTSFSTSTSSAVEEFTTGTVYVLWAREAMLLVLITVVRWLEFFNPSSRFWRPPIHASRSSSRRLRVVQVHTRPCCCGHTCVRKFIQASFLLNLVEALVVLVLNAGKTTDHTVAAVVLCVFGSGVTAVFFGLAALFCCVLSRNSTKLLQFITAIGAALCTMATTLAPWALTGLQHAAANSASGSLLHNHEAEADNLWAQIPLLLRVSVFTFTAAVWVLSEALDAEPHQRAMHKGDDDPQWRQSRWATTSQRWLQSARLRSGERHGSGAGGGACASCRKVWWTCCFLCCADELSVRASSGSSRTLYRQPSRITTTRAPLLGHHHHHHRRSPLVPHDEHTGDSGSPSGSDGDCEQGACRDARTGGGAVTHEAQPSSSRYLPPLPPSPAEQHAHASSRGRGDSHSDSAAVVREVALSPRSQSHSRLRSQPAPAR